MKHFLLAALIAFCVSPAMAAGNGIVSKPSRFSVPETIDRFEAAAKAKGAAIVARVDHAGAAAKAGLKMRPAQLLIFGNPKLGTPLMNAVPAAGIDLPLKVLAWEDEQGKVWLSYNDADWLRERHGLPQELMKGVAGVAGLADEALR